MSFTQVHHFVIMSKPKIWKTTYSLSPAWTFRPQQRSFCWLILTGYSTTPRLLQKDTSDGPNAEKRRGIFRWSLGEDKNKSRSSRVSFRLWSRPEDAKTALRAAVPHRITTENREKNLSGNSPWYHRQRQISTTDWVGWGAEGERRRKKRKNRQGSGVRKE